MSGSKSSAPGAPSAVPEPVQLTVHDVSIGSPDGDPTRRTRLGRLKMLLVLLVCASPVIASYFTYFVIRPEGRTNYGELVLPTRSLPSLDTRAPDGTARSLQSLKGQWLLVVVADASCPGTCERNLFMQRQLRQMLGRERERLDKVWLITGDGSVAPALQTALNATPAMNLLHVERDALGKWLQPAPGQALADHLYVVDPMGEWMMRMPVDPDPQRVKADLSRLLRASGFWDQPGR